MQVTGAYGDAGRQDSDHDPDYPENDNFELAGRRHWLFSWRRHPDNKIRELLFAG
jgi:hypothetical protein